MTDQFHLTATDNVPRNYAIAQGATFSSLAIVVAGDYTLWTPKGQIRDKYASSGGIVQAEFSFPPLVLGSLSVGGVTKSGTIVKPTLTDEQTSSLRWLETKMTVRGSPKEPAIAGRNVWVYDLKLESPQGEKKLILRGFVEVIPEVTR